MNHLFGIDTHLGARMASVLPQWLRSVWQTIVDVWTFELLQVEGEGLEVGRVLIAVILLLLGILLSRRVSSFLSRRLMSRFSISLSAGAMLQALSFYLFLGIFTLVALRLANVPLTVFAVLGGALAIGVGFGSQNLVNNFLSGLILMMEQPVKVGDIIEVSETFGTVERIGARSTVVRTPANTHIVVPNSSLLEQVVSNWTLSDANLRSQVTVGVAYGSDVRRVEELLYQAAEGHESILPSPGPVVFFGDFGDNALTFELTFWLRMGRMTDRRRIESDIRFAIDEGFRKADIVIAFPQRDLHLDSLKPIEVKMVGG